jgi:hypothetical protein
MSESAISLRPVNPTWFGHLEFIRRSVYDKLVSADGHKKLTPNVLEAHPEPERDDRHAIAAASHDCHYR